MALSLLSLAILFIITVIAGAMPLSWEQAIATTNFPELPIDAILLHSLNSSVADRDFILRAEAYILTCLFKNGLASANFSDLNSYYRMLVHRITRYYRLERMADGFQRTVIVFRPLSPTYRKPIVKLADLVEPEVAHTPTITTSVNRPVPSTSISPAPKMTIMRRSTASNSSAEAATNSSSTSASRTLEEREREYEQVRARIFDEIERDANHNDDQLDDYDALRETKRQMLSDNDNYTGPEDEMVHFQGWRNIDAIRPFVPTAISSANDIEEGIQEFDFSTIWIPQHVSIAVVSEIAVEEFKLQCKQHNCKPFVMGQLAFLLFKCRIEDNLESISSLIGSPCERWRPNFLPEPPV